MWALKEKEGWAQSLSEAETEAWLTAVHTTVRNELCCTIAPFGRPVDPEVYIS